ncbi:MAG: methionyl-tRNA formyltransferase [Pseudomonadota bacterium]
MAIIRKFEELDLKMNARHTETHGGWSIQGQDGEQFIQINTYGSDDREIPNKVSQSLRLSKEAIEQLAKLAQTHLK